MATLTVPDDFLTRLQSIATAEGYPSTVDYLNDLIEADERAKAAAPEHLRLRSRDHLAALAREGLASPAKEMTPADFAAFRNDLIRRHAPRPTSD